MKRFVKPGVLSALLFLLAFASCSARVDGVIKEGGAAELKLTASLEPRTAGLIRSLRDFMGEGAGTPIFDGAAISRSMATAPGIASVLLKNTGPTALEGSISISSVGDFLAPENAESRFITYTEGAAPGTSSIVMTLERKSAPLFISLLSPEVGEYLVGLMAPAITGEASTKKEYLDLLTMVYGRALSDEIAAARIRAQIEFPRPVRSVGGGRPLGNRAEFDIPLVDILVLESPLRYEVFW